MLKVIQHCLLNTRILHKGPVDAADAVVAKLLAINDNSFRRQLEGSTDS